MGNWGTPYMFGIYSVFAAAVIYLMIPTKTIDDGLIKIYDTATGFTATEYRGGSATKRHKRHKLKSCKKH